MRAGRRNDSGMTSVQVAVLVPALLLWVMLIVQYGLWWHAEQMANAAAAEAVDVAQVPGGTAAAGEASARSYLSEAGNLTGITVTVDRSPDTVRRGLGRHGRDGPGRRVSTPMGSRYASRPVPGTKPPVVAAHRRYGRVVGPPHPSRRRRDRRVGHRGRAAPGAGPLRGRLPGRRVVATARPRSCGVRRGADASAIRSCSPRDS